MSSESNGPPTKWTVMYYFASDNPLSPLLVSELKAIKDAGFQENTEVLIYFDPQEKGIPSRLYNVNRKRQRLMGTSIGDGKDSFVRKMDEDLINPITTPQSMQAVLNKTDEPDALKSLTAFLEFGRTTNAENYILFLVGHGMLIGNDAFLTDSNPVSAINLKQLKEVLGTFKSPSGGSLLRMLALHSCAMSSVEVAYELQDSADYMLATQANIFVNAWPYRQLLKKILNTIDNAKAGAVNIPELVEKLFFHCVHNATDFISAGYSADLSLVSLHGDKLVRLKEPLQTLVKKLKQNMGPGNTIKDLVLVAHWEAQSFFEENYTDLYDFCLCLKRRCIGEANDLMYLAETKVDPKEAPTTPIGKRIKELGDVADACKGVIKILEKRVDNLIVYEENFGWLYQYARGLSVYFPWSSPLDDDPLARRGRDQDCGRTIDIESKSRSVGLLSNYENYLFTSDFKEDSWFSFLQSYWDNTKRKGRYEKEGEEMFSDLIDSDKPIDSAEIDVLLGRIQTEFSDAVLAPKRTPELNKKTPEEGSDCTCPSIKNYPSDPRRMTKRFSITAGALRGFLPVSESDDLR